MSVDESLSSEAAAEPHRCLSCGRANAVTAARCLWCGVPIPYAASPDEPAQMAATTAELDYLDGIERFDNPAPVRLRIDASGIELKEILPGTRTVKLTTASLISAQFTNATVSTETEKRRSVWGWLLLGSESSKRIKTVREIKHDYILTLRYRTAAGEKTAVFHREDAPGLALVKNLAAIINSLIQSGSKGEEVKRWV